MDIEAQNLQNRRQLFRVYVNFFYIFFFHRYMFVILGLVTFETKMPLEI